VPGAVNLGVPNLAGDRRSGGSTPEWGQTTTKKIQYKYWNWAQIIVRAFDEFPTAVRDRNMAGGDVRLRLKFGQNRECELG
jgi:hypothetical protein